MGYDKEDVDSLPTADASTLNTERLARYQNIEDFPFNTSDNQSTQTITVYENYVRYDADGDGIAELRKILSVGDTSEFILENMPCDIFRLFLLHQFQCRTDFMVDQFQN